MHSEEIKKNILKLLLNDNISNYRISKDTGIPQSTLSSYVKRITDIEDMNFGYAMKLHDYYLKLKSEGIID